MDGLPPTPTPGTFQWISQLQPFNTWLKGDSSLMLLYAEPWCGKSVLARYLVESFFPLKYPGAVIDSHFFSGNVTAKDVSGFEEKIFGNSVVSPVICVLDAIDTFEHECLSSFVKRLRAPQTQKRFKFLATTRTEDSVINLFESSERISIYKYIKNDVPVVVDQKLNELNTRGDRERIYHDLRLNAIGQTPYLWVSIVFDVLGKLTGSKLQSKAWRQLMSTSQETFDIFQRLLTWPNGRFKGHEHPSYETVKKLLDIHLRGVLGPRPQRSKFKWRLEDNQHQHQLHEKALSDDGPSLAVINRTLYAVWRGHRGDRRLFWSKVEGEDQKKGWSQPLEIPNASTDARPSIAATENNLVALWKVCGSQTLQFSVFDHRRRNDRPKSSWSEWPELTSFGSWAGPAVTVLEKDNIYAAWRGTKGDDLMWRSAASFHGDKLKFQGQYPEYIDIHTKDRPAMASCRGRLYLAWTSSSPDSDKQILFSSLEVGSDVWDQPGSIHPRCHSSAAPSLAKFRDATYVVWRGKGDDTGIWLASCARPEESGYISRPQRLEGVATDCTPAIVEWEDKLVMAWKGGWGEDYLLWWGWGDILPHE